MEKKYDVIHIGESNLDITVPEVPDEFFTEDASTFGCGLITAAAETQPIRRCVSQALAITMRCSAVLTMG